MEKAVENAWVFTAFPTVNHGTKDSIVSSSEIDAALYSFIYLTIINCKFEIFPVIR